MSSGCHERPSQRSAYDLEPCPAGCRPTIMQLLADAQPSPKGPTVSDSAGAATCVHARPFQRSASPDNDPRPTAWVPTARHEEAEGHETKFSPELPGADSATGANVVPAAYASPARERTNAPATIASFRAHRPVSQRVRTAARLLVYISHPTLNLTHTWSLFRSGTSTDVTFREAA